MTKQEKFNRTPKRKQYMREWQRKYRKTEKAKEYDRKYRREYSKLPKVMAKKQKYLKEYYKRPNVRSKRATNTIKYRYGVSVEEYNELLKKQGGVCAICNEVPLKGKFHIDHDHQCCAGVGSCGKCIRGLLCNRCNWMLGNSGDSVLRLKNGIKYLKKRLVCLSV